MGFSYKLESRTIKGEENRKTCSLRVATCIGSTATVLPIHVRVTVVIYHM